MLRFLLLSLVIVIFTYFLLGYPSSISELPSAEHHVVPAHHDQYLDFLSEYDAFFEHEMKRTGTPGAAVVIVVDSTVIFSRGYGVKELGTRDSVNDHTIFRVGSLSKGFAGVLTGQLVKKDILNWDDYVLDHVPDLKLKSQEHAKQVKINHLLSHTSGLPYHMYTNLVEKGKDIETIATMLDQVNTIGKPGEIYAYQNVAFGLIELVMLGTTQQTFSKLLQEQIFSPSGMKDASSTYKGIMNRDNKAFPHYFDRRRKRYRKTPITEKYYNLPSAGGVNASAADMGQWIKVLLGYYPEIIDSTTLSEVFQPEILTDVKNRYFYNWSKLDDAYYAKGWRVLHFPQDTVVYHGGYVNEFRGEIAINREEKIGICALFNAPTSLAGYCIPEFWKMLDHHQQILERLKSFEQYTN